MIGITALFVASKIEEIYPPKLMEFAYVTDGACTEDQILTQELLLLKVSIAVESAFWSSSVLVLSS